MLRIFIREKTKRIAIAVWSGACVFDRYIRPALVPLLRCTAMAGCEPSNVSTT